MSGPVPKIRDVRRPDAGNEGTFAGNGRGSSQAQLLAGLRKSRLNSNNSLSPTADQGLVIAGGRGVIPTARVQWPEIRKDESCPGAHRVDTKVGKVVSGRYKWVS